MRSTVLQARRRAGHAMRTMAPGRRLRTDLALERLAAWGAGRRLRVLDAGAEIGLFALALAQRCPTWEVDAVDVEPSMLEIGRVRAAELGLRNVDFRVLDITRAPDADYDAVVALECLAEIPDTAAALDGIARSLRPGGRLALHVPRADWTAALPRSASRWAREVHHGFTREALADQLAARGLSVSYTADTMRTPVQAAHELRDRVKRRGAPVQLAAYPFLAAAVRLERRGLAFGPPRALYLEADRR